MAAVAHAGCPKCHGTGWVQGGIKGKKRRCSGAPAVVPTAAPTVKAAPSEADTILAGRRKQDQEWDALTPAERQQKLYDFAYASFLTHRQAKGNYQAEMDERHRRVQEHLDERKRGFQERIRAIQRHRSKSILGMFFPWYGNLVDAYLIARAKSFQREMNKDYREYMQVAESEPVPDWLDIYTPEEQELFESRLRAEEEERKNRRKPAAPRDKKTTTPAP